MVGGDRAVRGVDVGVLAEGEGGVKEAGEYSLLQWGEVGTVAEGPLEKSM